MSGVAHLPSSSSRTYGLHSTTWQNVKKALRLLGGNTINTPGKQDQYGMPNGATITVGPKNEKAQTDIPYDDLTRLLEEIAAAGIEPLLFLAVLDRVGCAWHTRPAAVANLAKWLRGAQRPLRTTAQQKGALTDFSKTHRAARDADAKPAPEPPHAPRTEEAPRPDPPATLPASNSGGRYPHTVSDVLLASGLPREARTKASAYASTSMATRTGVPGRLLKSGHAARIERPRGVKGSGKLNVFTEAGAKELAAELARRYGPPEQQPANRPPAVDHDRPKRDPQAPEASTGAPQAAPVREEEPVTADTEEPHAAPDPAPASPNGEADAHEPPRGGRALLALCEHHGVAPQWGQFDPFALDVPATITRLAEAARAKADQ